MSDLFELDLPARPESAIRHKVFFAVRPDADAAQQAHQLARTRRGLGGWITPPERLHVSLTHVASGPEIPSAVVARALDAAATIAARPFLLAFNRLATWGGKPGDRCVVLWGDEGVAGATGLQAALHGALTTAGVVRPAQAAFEPHLTLLRKQRDAPPEFIPPLRWWVREFLLIDSVHGEGRHAGPLDPWRLNEIPFDGERDSATA